MVRAHLRGLLPHGGPARLRTVRVATGLATASVARALVSQVGTGEEERQMV